MIRIAILSEWIPLRISFLMILFPFLVFTNGGCGGNTGPFSSSSEFISIENFQKASVVIGQPDFTGKGANQGTGVGAGTLASPAGGPAEGSLYLADQSNHRILGYNSIPSVNNKGADFVIGQLDFTSNASGTGSSVFRFPKQIWVSDSKLYLVDGNNRILIWNALPLSNQSADVVVGQTDFSSSPTGTSPSSLDQPSRVVAVGNKLIISDKNNHRVLIWNSIPTSNGSSADWVLGQTSFTSNTPGLSATQLNSPNGVWSNGTRLVVSDSGNHRVLIWNSFPIVNGAAADAVIGQADFETASVGTGAQGLSAPQDVISNGSQLFIADSGNHRILIYNRIPTVDQAEADWVLGQSTFSNNTQNDDDQDGTEDSNPSNRTLSNPTGISAIGNQLLVVDNSNHRVLIFKGN